MDLISLIGVAVALAMDAFAVSVAAGAFLKTVSLRQTFRLSWHFGLFQAVMPIIGWSAGLTVRDQIAEYDHWVAFALLGFVGVNMIRSGFKGEDADTADACDPTRGWRLVMLSIATSIDALAVGLTLSMLNVAIWTPAAVIGIVACAFTILGIHLGKALAQVARLGRYADFAGGIVLLLIGVNILRTHGALAF